jgi:hypothetical protein
MTKDEMKEALGEVAQRIEQMALGHIAMPTTLIFAWLVPCQHAEHEGGGDHDDYGRFIHADTREKVGELLTFLEQDVDGELNPIVIDMELEE